MPDYTRLGDTTGAFIGPPVWMYGCGDCGAVVADRIGHDNWHRAIALAAGYRAAPVSAADLRDRAHATNAGYLRLDDVSGVARIAAERIRQVEEEGWSTEHDDGWVDEQLAAGAVAYLMAAMTAPAYAEDVFWPPELGEFKPSTDPLRNLEKAGAMVAAELDRRRRGAPGGRRGSNSNQAGL